MKKYELKKDFPGSKIGDVWVKADNGFMSPEGRETIKMHENLFKSFNDWFDDYEEPKEYWYASCDGRALKATTDEDDYNEKHITGHKQIGNHFETKEETEKTVEKLKAITRLKSCGFKFKGWRTADLGADKYYFVITAESDGAGKGDLDLLFGGEE